MKTFCLVPLLLAVLAVNSLADDVTRYFKRDTKKDGYTVALRVESGTVTGAMSVHDKSDPNAEPLYGAIQGQMIEEGVLHITHNFMINGDYHQSIENLFKLDGGKLIIATGEKEMRGPGQIVFTDRDRVTFDDKPTVLNEVKMEEIDAADEKAKPFTSLVAAALRKTAGAAVNVLGTVRISGGWARITGNVEVPEGSQIKNEEIASRFAERTLSAYLKQDKDGKWTLIRHGFMSEFDYEGEGDDSQEAPWPLDEPFGEG